MSEFAVKAETHEGNIVTLRRHFATEESAGDHPVQMALWKRVWVEMVPVAVIPTATLPPRPWSVVPANNHASHIYITDATGKKIATIWGSIGERKLTAEHILELINGHERML